MTAGAADERGGKAMSKKSTETDAFFAAYRAATGIASTDYEVVAFGDSPAMATELALLVRDGPKRATAGLARYFEDDGDPMPVAGDYVVVIDGAGDPVCVWRTTEVAVKPLIEVDDAFAYDEGEGDRTRDEWLRMHRDYFRREANRDGFEFHDQLATVFERFAVVWPVPDAGIKA